MNASKTKLSSVHFQANQSCLATKTNLCVVTIAILSMLHHTKEKHWEKDIHPLIQKVMTALLEIVDAPNFHHVYFDNFFTSPNLLQLRRKRKVLNLLVLLGSIAWKVPLKDTKMEKMDRGSIDISATSFLCAVRWVDNKVVTVLSNHLIHEPLQTCRRYDRKRKNRVNVDQPNLIHKYNKYMGGVDQLGVVLV